MSSRRNPLMPGGTGNDAVENESPTCAAGYSEDQPARPRGVLEQRVHIDALHRREWLPAGLATLRSFSEVRNHSGRGRSRVLSLQTVGRGRAGARLLDHDRGRSHAGSLGGSCRTPGNGCGKPLSRLAISGSTPRTTRSCSRGPPAISSCVRRRIPRSVRVPWPRLKAPQVRRVDRASKSKVVHVIQIRHRDEVEAPFTDWLKEAYEWSGMLAAKAQMRGAS